MCQRWCLTTSVKTFRGFLYLRKITQNSAKGDQNAKKVTIKSVTFTYQGTEDDFLVFLNAIVRDYLTAKENLQSGIYDKVYTSEVFKAIIQLCNPENTVSMPAGTKVLRARIIKNTDDIYREKMEFILTVIYCAATTGLTQKNRLSVFLLKVVPTVGIHRISIARTTALPQPVKLNPILATTFH